MKLSQLDTPVLLVDEAPFLRNMQRMQDIAVSAGIAYRPHAKAHKSAEIAKMQLDAGACGVCCAFGPDEMAPRRMLQSTSVDDY